MNRSKPLKRTPMKRRGNNSNSAERRKWHRELLAEWMSKGIAVCEFRFDGCMPTFGLALAHSRKRRMIENREQYFEVGLACQQCHRQLDEKMSHSDMEQAVKDIIAKRFG